MSFELHRNAFPGIAASNCAPKVAVALVSGERAIAPVASNNERPFGVTIATALRTESVTVEEAHSIVKMTALASVGGGAEVGHASSNGAVNAVAGASGVTRWSIGQTVHAAGAGETVAVYVNPRQLSNLI